MLSARARVTLGCSSNCNYRIGSRHFAATLGSPLVSCCFSYIVVIHIMGHTDRAPWSNHSYPHTYKMARRRTSILLAILHPVSYGTWIGCLGNNLVPILTSASSYFDRIVVATSSTAWRLRQAWDIFWRKFRFLRFYSRMT